MSKVSIIIPARDAAQELKTTVNSLWVFLAERQAKGLYDFEIILVPNGDDPTRTMSTLQTIAVAEELASTYKEVHAVEWKPSIIGKGAALSQGFAYATGSCIVFVDADLPYGLEFIDQAIAEIQNGAELVSGNRRVPESTFTLPSSLLPLVYKRHKAGLRFNFAARLFLKLKTTDTQAGIKAMTRTMANRIFSSQTCFGFLFDLEIFLVARAIKAKSVELPVRFELRSEKSTVRLFKELISGAYWILRIFIQEKLGFYSTLSLPVTHQNPRGSVTADDWGLSPAINRGILALAKKGIVHRVSVLVDGRFVKDDLDELIATGVSIGLHYNVTYERAFRSPAKLLLAIFNPLSNRSRFKETLVSEFERQFCFLDQILAAKNSKIGHFDSHHHVHVFPKVWKILSPLLKTRGIRDVRLPFDRRLWLSQKFPLLLFALMTKKRFKSDGWVPKPCFYPQLSINGYRDLNQIRFNSELGHEVIVHPADEDDFGRVGIADSYSAGRVLEFEALNRL